VRAYVETVVETSDLEWLHVLDELAGWLLHSSSTS